MAETNRFKYLFYKELVGNSATLFLSSIEGFMGLKEEQSVFLFNEGFLIESRFRVDNLFYEGLFKPDKMREALSRLSSKCEM